MTRIKLSPLKIVSFDGEVLEVFDGYDTSTIRIHVGHLKSIEITTDRKGNQMLTFANNSPIANLPFEPPLTGKVQALLDEVKKAMANLAW